jgi:hypothetical protein
MKTPIDTFCGSPLEIESEIEFYDALLAAFQARGQSALVCANFQTPRNPHQIDFLVITENCACHVELKNLTAPVIGGTNGPWELILPNGDRTRLETAKNPYRQALDAKFAISDAMHDLAILDPSLPQPSNGNRYYKTFESVVCVYPKLLPGSDVPSDFKVRTSSFDDLIELLCKKPARRPLWCREHWLQFAMFLRLLRKEDGDSSERTTREHRRLVDEYRQRCEAFFSRDLPTLVPTTVTCCGDSLQSTSLLDILDRRQHAKLIGESGTGKSLLARHLVIAATRSGDLVIFAQARHFDSRLSSLLTRSIAHLHPGTAIELIEAAAKTGVNVSLILDGINECPHNLRDTLVADVAAFALRWPVPIIVTSQRSDQIPSDLTGKEYEFSLPNSDERAAILGSYIPAVETSAILPLCDPFRTPFELSLAAEAISDITGKPHRTSLLDTFIRQRCERTPNPILARRILVAIAERMHDELKSNLSQLEMWPLILPLCEQYGSSPSLVSDLFDLQILESSAGKYAFRHELFETFMQAEALLRKSAESESLSHLLCKPRSRALAPAVLGLLRDDAVIKDVLCALNDSRTISLSLIGACGEVAQLSATALCRQALRAGLEGLSSVDLQIEWQGQGPTKYFHVDGGTSLLPSTTAGLFAVGEVLHHGLFLTEALTLARQTDESCRAELARLRSKPPSIGLLDSLYQYGLIFNPRVDKAVLPAAVVYHGSRSRFRIDTTEELSVQLQALLGTLGERSPIELFILCSLKYSLREADGRLVPELVRACLASGLYHLQHEGLDVARAAAHVLNDALKEQVKQILGSIEIRDDPFTNTTLIETMLAYDMVDSPVSDEEALAEIKQILSSNDDLTVRRKAYNAVTRIFEDVFQDAYYSALESLDNPERERLMTLAALGTDGSVFFADWILRELVANGTQASLPAFLQWVHVPVAPTVFPQETTACFLAAIEGCARHLTDLPDLGPVATDDQRAWATYAAILFRIYSPAISEADRRSHCVPYWSRLLSDLLFQAVDPLVQFFSADRGEFPHGHKSAFWHLREVFPDEIRQLLEFGIRHHARLTSIFGHAPLREYLPFLIQQLSKLGNRRSVAILEPFLNSSEFGEDAANTIRTIQSR